jgi:phosphoribosylformylglycinamidine cyclo-ligase
MTPDPYKDAGVDVDAGEAFVKTIAPLAEATRIPGAAAGLGGFAAAFDTKAAGFKDPVLVAATDGVGTKLLVAIRAGVHTTVGIDLVAMSVNDVLTVGARPLFFLDYFATGKLEPERDREVLQGISQGCLQAGCALIGGETAEMPGVYKEGDYDLAGFVVGALERGTELGPRRVKEGMVLVGLASNGLHSNGFSLVRKLVFERAGLEPGDVVEFLGRSVADELLAPTRIYSKLLPLFRKHQTAAMAHITGGGLAGNLARVVPEGMRAVLHRDAWPRPRVFDWLGRLGKLSDAEMEAVFNCGLGLIAVVPRKRAEALVADLSEAGEFAYRVGELAAAPEPPRAVVV